MTRALSVCWRGVVWLVILLGVAALALVVVLPRLAGATPYTVLTGSMRPALPPGTLVVATPVRAMDLRVGDVVTYQPESGVGRTVTHRVVGVSTTLDGEVRLRTQGDANDAADPEPVRPVQVSGRLWYAVPYLGHANTVLSVSQRKVALFVVLSGLLAYAAYMFTSAGWERYRRAGGTAVIEDSERVADKELAR